MGEPPMRVSNASARWAPGFRVGRYELLSSIAEGGMAAVWVARLQGEHGFEKLVAIKTILAQFSAEPRYAAMFLDEARIIANIRHPNVAQILDLGSDEALPYLVLEWIEGDSLSLLQRAAAQNKLPIPVPVALHVLARMCAGLHAAHELCDRSGKRLNVVHRDVSPQNVLLSIAGEVKLIDFGIAKALDQMSQETHTGVLKGKISFMSPEQANGERLDARADIWATGVVLYQLLCGELPFRGESQLKTLHQIRSRVRPPPISGLPTALQKLLDRMLEPNRDLRIASAAELESEVERVSHVVGFATTRDVAALVQEHLGPRIAARRAIIDAALSAANHRSRLVHALDHAIDRARDRDATVTAVQGSGRPLVRTSPPATSIAFDGTTPRVVPSLTLMAQLEPSTAGLLNAEVTDTLPSSTRPSSPELATPSGAVLMPSSTDTLVDLVPARRGSRLPPVMFLGLALVAGVALLLALGGVSHAPAIASASGPSVKAAPSAALLSALPLVPVPPAASVAPTASVAAPAASEMAPLAGEPPVVRVEDMPTAPTHPPATVRAKPAPRVVKPKPERDVWSAFSEHR